MAHNRFFTIHRRLFLVWIGILALIPSLSRGADLPRQVQSVQIHFDDGTEQTLPAQLAVATTTAPTGDHSEVKVPQAVTTLMAPAAIHVRAPDLPEGISPLLTRYQWDFADQAGRFSNLEGFNAAHIYDTPGDYVIRLRFTYPDRSTRTLSTSIRIVPDTRPAIYLATDGNDENLGNDPDHPIRSLVRAQMLLRNNTKLLLRKGDRFEQNRTFRLNYANVMLGAYGQGDNPQLVWTGREDGAMVHLDKSSRQIVIQDLTFDADKDGATQYAIEAAGQAITIRRCEFRRVGNAINANGRPRGLLVQDNSAPLVAFGIKGYFLWMEGSDLTILSNTVANVWREHVLRGGFGVDHVLIAHNDFANLDRKAQGDKLDWAKGCIVAQDGSYVYIANNITREGGIGAGPLGGDDGFSHRSARTRYVVIENNQCINKEITISHGAEHVMIRNNLLQRRGWRCIEIQGFDARYDRGVSDLWIVNNTAMVSGANGSFMRLLGPAQSITLANNLLIAPDVRPSDANNCALSIDDDSLAGFASISHNVWGTKASADDGIVQLGKNLLSLRQWNALPQVKEDLHDLIETDPQGVPPAGSSAASHGRSVPGVWTDRLGNPRPESAPWSAGAIQVTQ
ncbi:MAG: PKD domain-containing protein [Phycisphaerales bacterium]|nr:PKD domain-containing protein [Phycisphaerales bacterium]